MHCEAVFRQDSKCGDWIRDSPQNAQTIDVFSEFGMDNWPRYTPSYHVPTSARFDDFCYFTWMAESLWYQLVVGKHPGLISHGWPSVKTRVSWRRGRIQESVWGRWPWSLALLRMGILDKNRMEKRGRRNVGGVDFVCVAHKESEGKP